MKKTTVNKNIDIHKHTESDDSDELDSELESIDSEDDIDVEKSDIIDPVKFFEVKELCYFKTIDKFFKSCSDESISQIVDIMESKSNISLRRLEHFVTKYSKKKVESTTKDAEIFDIRISYRSQLKSYKKRYFDPFRRRRKFVYQLGTKNTYVNTTLGQLNFFKWIISANVLPYVTKNLKYIVKDMEIMKNETKDKKSKKGSSKTDKSNNSNNILKTKTTSKNNIKKMNDVKSSESDSFDNVKINATKTTENNEVRIILKFD